MCTVRNGCAKSYFFVKATTVRKLTTSFALRPKRQTQCSHEMVYEGVQLILSSTPELHDCFVFSAGSFCTLVMSKSH